MSRSSTPTRARLREAMENARFTSRGVSFATHDKSDVGGKHTCDGALAHAALAAGNSDDFFNVRDAALWWEPATRHHRGFTTLRETL